MICIQSLTRQFSMPEVLQGDEKIVFLKASHDSISSRAVVGSRLAACGGADKDVNGERGSAGACAEGAIGKPGAEFVFGIAGNGFAGKTGAAGNPTLSKLCKPD